MIAAKYKDLGDPELVALCLNGESQAWEALIMRYRRLMFSIPVRFGFTASDASDVFQSVCLKLLEHLHELKDERKVSAWLITTTTRQCIHLRSSRQRETTPENDYEEPLDPADTMEDIRIQVEEQEAVREAVQKLPERCRKLVEMLYFDSTDPSYERIAESMEMPVPSVGPTRARCLEKLKTLLRRKGYQ